jgi:hypothetical protein
VAHPRHQHDPTTAARAASPGRVQTLHEIAERGVLHRHPHARAKIARTQALLDRSPARPDLLIAERLTVVLWNG